MNDLGKLPCEACRADAPALDEQAISALHAQLPCWSLVTRDGVRQLERGFAFADFKAALAFANAIGELAEEENHHPALRVEWGKVRVNWWTHKIHDVHRNDFILAARCDEAFARLGGPSPAPSP
ncbi:4a-hydroxytetrahydrobiopterin dehydratase [Pseudomonas sp. PS02288]|uniref:4a-hydroxytetrahydrobiopterin dehydratase n=1 Tax=Pseudomonas sp. PS02288 TaxID=2991443 RepID=UPI00249AC64A|nr:4a-hydroxytetrahydrobiopterin dehydratase [Pseudomonas sp. PS02288]